MWASWDLVFESLPSPQRSGPLFRVIQVAAESWSAICLHFSDFAVCRCSAPAPIRERGSACIATASYGGAASRVFCLSSSPWSISASATPTCAFRFRATPATLGAVCLCLHSCKAIDLLFACSLTGFGLACVFGCFHIY